jgi:hypothetical protein
MHLTAADTFFEAAPTAAIGVLLSISTPSDKPTLVCFCSFLLSKAGDFSLLTTVLDVQKTQQRSKPLTQNREASR